MPIANRSQYLMNIVRAACYL